MLNAGAVLPPRLLIESATHPLRKHPSFLLTLPLAVEPRANRELLAPGKENPPDQELLLASDILPHKRERSPQPGFLVWLATHHLLNKQPPPSPKF